MYREIIIPTNTTQTIEIPEEFIGKQVEIIAFAIEEKETDQSKNEKAFKIKIARHPRVGVNAIVKEAPKFYSSGILFMAYAREGYVGLVRLEDGSLNIAAALDP